jgi:DNA-binding response OmpR family regulator
MNEEIHILIVDDNKHNLKIASNLLQEKGYQIALALDGESVFKIMESNRIDLILLDIMMPGMDGFEVCIKLKENVQTQNIPVIFLTAKTETDDLVKGFQVGGVDYITKPFKKEELYARVNNHIQLKLFRDLLKKRTEESLISRDKFISMLSELGKKMDSMR